MVLRSCLMWAIFWSLLIHVFTVISSKYRITLIHSHPPKKRSSTQQEMCSWLHLRVTSRYTGPRTALLSNTGHGLKAFRPLNRSRLEAHILTPNTGIQGCFSARCRSLAPEDRSGRPLDVFLGNRTQHLEKVLTMQKVMHIQKSGCIFM